MISKSEVSMAVVYPTDVAFVHQDYIDRGANMAQIIHNLVDGHFDVVRPSNRDQHFVGYVNDEGLLTGMEPNTLASAIFGRFLCGPCVIVGTLNENGVEDGDSYNLQTKDVQYLSRLAEAALMWQDNLPSKLETEMETA